MANLLTRHTPIAWLHRLIWVYIPNGFLAVDQGLTGGRVSSYTARFARYLMYDKHPTILVSRRSCPYADYAVR
jgi:palmitoyltransferase